MMNTTAGSRGLYTLADVAYACSRVAGHCVVAAVQVKGNV